MQLLQRPRTTRDGFSLVDVCVALAILAVALGTLVGTIFWSMRLDEASDETAIASQSLRGMLESFNAMSIGEVYASYNADPNDDPLPGHDYKADLVVDDPLLVVGKKHGPVVSIEFPADAEAQLAANKLPITMRLEWEGAAGTRTVEMSTLLRNP